MNGSSEISLRSLVTRGTLLERLLYTTGPLLDRLLGIDTIDSIYQQHGLNGLDPFEFCRRGLDALGVSILSDSDSSAARIPTRGRLLVVSNHPFGGVEALALISALGAIRRDLKVLANGMLTVFPELKPIIIPTNPLRVSARNVGSIRQCEAQLNNDGVLIVFPAGKVSFHQKDRGRIADGSWNRIVGHLAGRTASPLMPVFFSGTNSRTFHVMGRVWDRAKLLLLPREMLKLRGRPISFRIGRVLPASLYPGMSDEETTALARVMTYLQDPAREASKSGPLQQAQPGPAALAKRLDPRWMTRELTALADRNRLLVFKQYSVWYARARQIPTLMSEITRERERVFREHDEGSGAQRDADEFDSQYVQLLVWDEARSALVGAYRMGRTDRLIERCGYSSLYLSRMFEFDPAFHAQSASLELGRSFVVPEYQKSYHALYLLWKGIGRYLCLRPQYRRLYGTVSLSRQYDPQAIALMCAALITPDASVRPRYPMQAELHPELRDLIAQHPNPSAMLGPLVRAIDNEGKDLPVLLRHYLGLGARFHCVGVDPNFNETPGLLLSVAIPQLAPKTLTTFLGKGAERYLEFDGLQAAKTDHTETTRLTASQ